MKTLLVLLFFTSHIYAQPPQRAIRRDSMPNVLPPDLMPNVRPGNSFYRHHLDPPNVVRATLDNMPVKVPDSSTNYTMLRSNQRPWKPAEPPMQLLKPIRPVLPKTFPN